MTHHAMHLRLLTAALFLALAVSGMILGLAVGPRDAAAATCAQKACNPETEKCFPTDINFKCHPAGLLGICSSQPC